MVGGALDDTNPNRELIKEGKVIKVSARDGIHLERYLFLVFCLFLFLDCTEEFANVFLHSVSGKVETLCCSIKTFCNTFCSISLCYSTKPILLILYGLLVLSSK